MEFKNAEFNRCLKCGNLSTDGIYAFTRPTPKGFVSFQDYHIEFKAPVKSAFRIDQGIVVETPINKGIKSRLYIITNTFIKKLLGLPAVLTYCGEIKKGNIRLDETEKMVVVKQLVLCSKCLIKELKKVNGSWDYGKEEIKIGRDWSGNMPIELR